MALRYYFVPIHKLIANFLVEIMPIQYTVSILYVYVYVYCRITIITYTNMNIIDHRQYRSIIYIFCAYYAHTCSTLPILLHNELISKKYEKYKKCKVLYTRTMLS